ncbi:response regulator [Roseomonas sp. E05]|uniref:ATP-binding protein n=1 Tax=Roseomonas sp. E05 TaxID=3046310 RepID=UPI0024BBDF2A|nr:ATP-binding protein [Roseomonas sp. E05]MDJ0388735.1 response regulator [Roseomonas sp. E05]
MTPARILIVEDELIIARDLQQQLTRIAHTVIGLSVSGEEAIAIAAAERPDIVLMDLRLEGRMDGVDAARHLREAFQIPVIFLTAYADPETVRRASQAEPQGYLLKPFEDLQLFTTIELALRKHSAERRLQESERRWEATLSSIGDGVIATDGEQRITFMNPVAEALTGWEFRLAAGLPLGQVVRLRQAGELTEPTAAEDAGDVVLVSRPGREIHVREKRSPILDGHGRITGAVLILADMTRRREAEAAFRQAQAEMEHAARLTSMGELVASIAHEINQPLMSISANAAALGRWLSHGPSGQAEVRAASERILRDSGRAADIVRNILGMARKAAPSSRAVDVNGLVRDMLRILEGKLRQHGVALHAGLQDGLPSIQGNAVQLQQVVLNLAVNAIEAMAGMPEPALHITSCLAEDGIVIRVEDNGPGVDSAQAEKIFDAFYTTKPAGMGLGLLICRTIIHAHAGSLTLAPNRPSGCIFQIHLPSCVAGKIPPSGVARQRHHPMHRAPRRREHQPRRQASPGE